MIGTESQPLRVAIVGAGPAGFYAAEHLFKQKSVVVQIDMFDRLPTPFGLVRAGVAPDHQKIKSVVKIFDRTARKPGFRFFGNVELGSDISMKDLLNHYHQVVISTGAQTDRQLNIPGIELAGSHPATEFVAWYNGHPDFRDRKFDLSQESAAVIGIGNVAVDVARILCRTPDELAKTDIADYALDALRLSKVKRVYMLGRRGPAQGAFTSPELKELGELDDADVIVLPEEAKLDPLSEVSMADADRGTTRKVEILQDFACKKPTGKSRKLYLRFLISPTELEGNDLGQVTSMKCVQNELYATEAGTLRPKPIEKFEEIDVGLVFRSIGYRGVPIPDIPFNESWGVINNEAGRITDPETGQVMVGCYSAGWIKRGPSGVIGTNKPDAAETVDKMLEDLAAGRINQPLDVDPSSVKSLIKERQPNYFSYQDWLQLDQLEVERGQSENRPRVKFTTVEEMIKAVKL
jgi:ferredoxin--NADP+ reductase